MKQEGIIISHTGRHGLPKPLVSGLRPRRLWAVFWGNGLFVKGLRWTEAWAGLLCALVPLCPLLYDGVRLLVLVRFRLFLLMRLGLGWLLLL